MLKDINPYSIDDLKKVHGVMTFLVEEVSGEFRTSSEGVFDDNGNCIFVCPPGDRVNLLMNDLFKWLNENKDTIHPLILSSIFHYEFVFIHPFTMVMVEQLDYGKIQFFINGKIFLNIYQLNLKFINIKMNTMIQ